MKTKINCPIVLNLYNIAVFISVYCNSNVLYGNDFEYIQCLL